MQSTAPPPRSSTRLAFALAALVLAALQVWLYRAYGPVDDDYINFRYARNLAEGVGLVYEPPGRVEGFTAPAWVLFISGGVALGIPAEPLALCAGALAFAVAVLACCAAWQRIDSAASVAAPAVLLAASSAVAWHSVAGLGTAPAAALVALWANEVLRVEPTAAQRARGFAWLALAMLVRPELSLLAAVQLAAELAARRRIGALASCAPLAAWFAFRRHYYGEWLPVTWKVKKLALLDDLSFGLEYLRISTRDCGVGLFALAALACLFWKRDRIAGGVRLLAAAALAYCAFVVYVGGDYLALAHFFVPVLPLLVLVGCAVLRAMLDSRVAFACVVAGLSLWLASPQLRRGELAELYEYDERRWLAIGRELAASAPAGTRVALSPIGAIGYESRLPIVDILGRTNDVVWRSEPDTSIPMKGHQRYNADWTLAQAPDVIVLGNGVFVTGSTRLLISAWERTLYEHPTFVAAYEPYSIPIRDSYVLAYFQRRGGKQLRGGTPIPAHRRL